MKNGFLKRLLVVLLTVCMLISTLPLNTLIMDAEAVSGVNSLTCSSFISNSTARNYIDKMMRYYINSSSTLQSTLNNGNSVVFMFEGGSDNYWNGTTYYNGAYNTRTQAVCIVVKMNSSGNAYIDYYCENSSSIPSEPTWCTNGVAYSGSTTLMDGTYSFFTWNHTGPYAAFQINLNASSGYCYYTPSENPNGYKAGASGINIHTRSTSYGGGSSLGWAWSEGCQVIGYGNDSSNEFNKFVQSVTGITWNPWISWTNKTLNTWTSDQLYSYEGYYVVDRQLALTNPSGTKYGSGSLGSLYNSTALTNITAASTAAKNAAGADTVDYISQCTAYPAYGTLTCTGTDVWCRTLPCYASVDSSTVAISSYNSGDQLTCTGLYKNTIGEYWYEVISRSGSTTYVRAAYMDYNEQLLTDISMTDHTKPNGHVTDTGFVIDGNIKSTYNQLTAVSAYVLSGFGKTGAQQTGHRVTFTGNSYTLSGSVVDNNVWMNVMEPGNYTLLIATEYKNYYVTNDTTLNTNTGTVYLAEDYFMVIPSSVSQSSCTHTYQTYPVGSGDGSCTSTNQVIKACTTCGLMGSVTSSTGSHSYGAWVTTAATCTTNGSKVRTCSACGYKETETIPATGHSYTSVKHEANCKEYAKTVYTCSVCGDSYTETGSAVYSEWSETKPEGIDESLIETKTEYRFSEYEQVKNYETSMDGYTLFSKEWEESKTGTVYYVPSWPSGFDKTSSIYNEYNGTKKTASEDYYTKTTINSDALVGYLYYHWCYDGSYYSYSSKQGNYTTFHAYYATGNPNNYECDTSDMSYKTSNTACCTNSNWYFVTNVYAQNYTEYKALYTHSRWTEWSEWGETEYVDDWNTDVETRTLYRYLIDGGLGDHVFVNGTCSVCGAADKNGMYLFGYINGADYACNDDADNAGIYKFENGKLTATFTDTSYVAVKKGDNTAWYMTNGYPGDDATSATLYNTNSGIDANKLRVPKGREITFTLVDNGNDTFTLSYVAAVCEHPGHTLDGYCSTCGDSVEHTFVQGACTVCGKPCTHDYDNGTCRICGAECTHNFSQGSCTICKVPCEHTWSNGKCAVCGLACTHQWIDGECQVCGTVCEHKWSNGVCTVCSVVCQHSWTDGKCNTCSVSCQHSWTDGICTTCGTVCEHDFANGECTICKIPCQHNWYEGKCTICEAVCQHSWTDGKCDICGLICEHSWENGECTICKEACEHEFSQGACTNCGIPCEHQFTDGKCTICEALCDHTWKDSVCTVCGKVCENHSYVNSSCAICGRAEPDYYLFGYIDGEDYGCQGDADTNGIYKFKNGTLKAVFTQDSYVAVKMEDNENIYMTNSYPGDDATSAILYNVNSGIQADKLRVPKGRLITFTLVDNGNDTYTLSYEAEACKHSIHNTDGICTTCGDTVEHTYKNSICTICGKGCQHSFEDDTCTVCGYVCEHIWIDGECAVCHIVCNHSFTDGACSDCGTSCEHIWSNGECDICGYACEHNWKDSQCTECAEICEHTWANGICSQCKAECSHNFENGICTVCLSKCEHTWIDGACDICGKICEHTWTNGTCAQCGVTCSHNFENGICTICSASCNHTWTGDTCNSCGTVCGHIWADGICSQCESACQHNIIGDTCTICAKKYQYYLVGNIDGENVGCEENYEFLGQNMFSNGSLSMVINNDSYVFVKTQDNQNWYLVSEKQTADSVTLSKENGSEMMFVPGGVKVIFTLLHNEDGTITLSYDINRCTHTNHDADGHCTSCGSVVAHSYSEGVCTKCGYIKPQPEVLAKYIDISMENEIMYNVSFSLKNIDSVDESKMGLLVFDANSPEGTLATASDVVEGAVAANGKYTVHTMGIHPKALGDTVYLKVYVQLSDGSYVYSDIMSYNAVHYANTVLKNPNSSTAKKSFMVSLLNYGAEAQKYFGYNTNSLANAKLTTAQKSLAAEYSENMAADTAAVDRSKLGEFAKAGKATLLYPTVSFEDTLFSVNYNCKTSSEVDGNITLYYWDAEIYENVSQLTAENASGTVIMTKSENGDYVGSISDIAAKDIDRTIYVAAVYESNGITSCSGVISYSMAEYCKVYADNSTSDMQALAKAAIVYGYYAKNYFSE